MNCPADPIRLSGRQFETIVRNLSEPHQPAEWIEIGYDQSGCARVAYELTDGEHGVACLNNRGAIVDLFIAPPGAPITSQLPPPRSSRPLPIVARRRRASGRRSLAQPGRALERRSG